ncbi:MAG: hypothetical protein LUC30_05095 [Clostridiales bacterium]|nr:hypothetical protein [Clostridiales bacterium]
MMILSAEDEQIREENLELNALVNNPVAVRQAERAKDEAAREAAQRELMETRQLIAAKKERARRDARKAAQLRRVLVQALYLAVLLALAYGVGVLYSSGDISAPVFQGSRLGLCVLALWHGVQLSRAMWRWTA